MPNMPEYPFPPTRAPRPIKIPKGGSTGKAALALGLSVSLFGVGLATNSVEGFKGKVVNPVRERLCDFKSKSATSLIGRQVLSSVDCSLYIAEKKPSTTGNFTLDASTEIGRIDKSVNLDQSRRRLIDVSSASITTDSVTRILMPGFATAVGDLNKKGIWKVTGPNGGGIDISQIKFRTPYPDVGVAAADGTLKCQYSADDARSQGCINTAFQTGFWNGLPMLGADNKTNLPRSIWRTSLIMSEDVACPIESALIPALSDPGKAPITANEAMQYLVRANVRSAAVDHGIPPQDVDVLIDAKHPFTVATTMQAQYDQAAKEYSYMPKDLKLPADACAPSAGGSSTFENSDGNKLDFSYIKAMGAVQVPDGFNPNDPSHPDPTLRRAS